MRPLHSSRIAMRRLQELDAFHDAGPVVAEDILERLKVLEAFPEAGRQGRKAGTRELPLSGTPFVAVYRVTKHTIDVLTLIHGAQRWSP